MQYTEAFEAAIYNNYILLPQAQVLQDEETVLASGLGSRLHGIQRERGVGGGLAGRRGAGQQKDLRLGRAAVAQGAVLLPPPPPTGQVLRQPPPSPAPLELVLHLENGQGCCVWHAEEIGMY